MMQSCRLPLKTSNVRMVWSLMAWLEKARWKKLRWVWCKDCGGRSINKVGWVTKKNSKALRHCIERASEYEDALKKYLFISRGGKAAQTMVAKDKQRSEAGLSRETAPQPEEYKIDFGQNGSKTINDLLNADK